MNARPVRDAGARAALILGILVLPILVLGSLLTMPLRDIAPWSGPLTALLAIATAIVGAVMGHRASGRIKRSQGRLTGKGMATAGIWTSYVSLGLMLVVVLAAMVFVLVNNLGKGDDGSIQRSVTIAPGNAWLQGFPVGDGATYEFQVNSTNGEPFWASLRPVDEWMDPDVVPGASPLWSARGTVANTRYTFAPGDFALVMVCETQVNCKVRYTITRVDAGDTNGTATTTPGITPGQGGAFGLVHAGIGSPVSVGSPQVASDWPGRQTLVSGGVAARWPAPEGRGVILQLNCSTGASDVEWDSSDSLSSGCGWSASNPSPSGNIWFFNGRQFDPAGNYYYRARHYHPTLGQFMSADPLGPWFDAVNLGNPYAYPGAHHRTFWPGDRIPWELFK